jgi:Zn-dependent membrane protease YugP
MLALRSAYVPAARFGSGFAFPMLFAGMIFRYPPLIFIGIALFSAVVLFQFITLPVEFNASARAKRVLADSGIISDEEEMRGVRSVLGAAALTYVAATIQAVLTLLYYLWRSGLLGRR